MRRDLLTIYKKLHKHFGPQGWWPGNTVFEIIVGAILTQNTSWSNVEKAIDNLKRTKTLSVKAFRRTTPSRIARLIRPSGYYNIKTGRLINFLNFLDAKSGGALKPLSKVRTDTLRKALLEINGIGPETADSMLLYAFNRPVFVVDAYTRRIFSRHGIVKSEAAYERIQQLFMSNLPGSVKIYNEYHALIVRTGKEFCRKKPKCGACPLRKGTGGKRRG